MRLKIISILVFLFLMIPSISIPAEEKRNLYPNMLTYNSTASCIQGVVSLLLELNPNLRNQMLPPAIIQQLISHCSCIMDKIRLTYPVEEYYANMHDYIWIRDLWGKHGAECVNMGYLAGLSIGNKPQSSDNQTTEEPKENKPEPKIEEPEPEDTQNKDTTFQG